MISELIDFTTRFNADNQLIIDTGSNRFVSFQLTTATGPVNITGTNDGGANGDASTATNFQTMAGYSIGAPTTAITAIATDTVVKVECTCKFIKLAGAVTADKVTAYFQRN